jgi:cell division protein FtsI (penicillin-binding protein 3)
MTAAQMRRMLEEVVLFGTGRRAILNGYTSAGKTGTAQKVDPRTGRYSPTDYVASFAGFAPVNNPAVSIIVIIDSARGLHQGGQVSAPVFARIAQQVLAYMNVPHDAEIKNDPRRQMLLAKVKDEDLSETAEHVGEPLATDDAASIATPGPSEPQKPKSGVMNVSAKQVQPVTFTAPAPPLPDPNPAPQRGTVIVDVEGGQEVPSFIGMPMRSAIRTAQQSGFELTILGSGVAREQSPSPGTRLPVGSKVAVRFTR